MLSESSSLKIFNNAGGGMSCACAQIQLVFNRSAPLPQIHRLRVLQFEFGV